MGGPLDYDIGRVTGMLVVAAANEGVVVKPVSAVWIYSVDPMFSIIRTVLGQ
jgi:hypothetical protein